MKLGNNDAKLVLGNGYILDNNYQVLDYLQVQRSSTIKQEINLNFIANQDTKVEMKCNCNADSGTGSVFFHSARTATSGSPTWQGFGFYINGVGGKVFVDYSGDVNITDKLSVLASKGLHTFILDKNKFYRDGNLVFTDSEVTFTNEGTLRLFTAQVGTQYQYYFKGLFYYCKVWDNGTLVRDCVPVINLTTNEVGVYDKLNKVFYSNIGSGNFIEGPKTPNPIYIGSTKVQ